MDIIKTCKGCGKPVPATRVYCTKKCYRVSTKESNRFTYSTKGFSQKRKVELYFMDVDQRHI